MGADTTPALRVLIADGRTERLDEVARVVASLGHDVIPRRTDLTNMGPMTAQERPDVALVIVGDESRKALELIGTIVHEAACPVIAIFDVQDRAFVIEAASLAQAVIASHRLLTGARPGSGQVEGEPARRPETPGR